ncbi:MAG: hypothetical protein ACTHLE_22750 [Agriterribacter sp.]
MSTRLEKAINGLKQVADRYKKQHLFDFTNDYVKIKPKTDKTLWLWLYVFLLILAPVGVCIYLLTQPDPDTIAIVITLGLAGYFGVALYSVLRGEQTLIVNWNSRQFVLEQVHKTFTRQKDPVRIDFSHVHTLALKETAFRYNNRWTRISFCDSNGNTLACINLGADFPDNLIAEKLKFFLEVVLWTFNRQTPESA